VRSFGALAALCAANAPGRRLGGLLVLALALPGAAAAAPPSLSDVEDEVMCPICGTLLELSAAPQAERQRVLVRRLIAQGRSKAQIKDALVAEYGPAVLALPEPSGFDLSAYLVPALAIAAALAALALGLARWRREGGRAPPSGDEQGRPSGEAAERLEADLDRYDL